jgi:hypothetical protein
MHIGTRKRSQMHLKRIIGALIAAAGLSLVLLTQTIPAASAAPAAHTVAAAHTGASSSTASHAIKWRVCTSVNTTSIVTEIRNYKTVALWCFSYKGTWKFNTTGGYTISYFCSGNNRGSFTYLYKYKPYTFNFGPGKKVYWKNVTIPDKLTITGWSGGDRC